MTKSNNKIKIAIIGYGRFGRLLAELLSPFGDIYIVSPNKINNNKLKRIKYRELKLIDWAIISVPISAFKEVLKKTSKNLKAGSLIIDVCSVKILPCRWLKKYARKDIEILGTHPMFGPDSAKEGLSGLQVVICPLRISKSTLKRVKNIFKALKLKTITTTPEEHDKQAAISLALVHFLGRGLFNMNIKKQQISTLGFERLLAINEIVNNDTWQLFIDMHKYNPYTDRIRKKLISSLIKINTNIKKEVE